ncbi:phasin family protein [Rhodovibrio sodomensis]|nr:TIGR01841 family phasin [Rhodovibrio sodomensis]
MAHKTGNPFIDQNLSEMFNPHNYLDQFQIPGLDNQNLMEAHRKNIEALAEANRVVLEGAQAMVRLQTETVCTAMDEVAQAMQLAQQASSNEEIVAKQTEIYRSAFETALKHAREMTETGAKSQNDALELLNKRVAANLDEMRDKMQTLVKQSESATAQATSALQSAGQAATGTTNGSGQVRQSSARSSSSKGKRETTSSTTAS